MDCCQYWKQTAAPESASHSASRYVVTFDRLTNLEDGRATALDKVYRSKEVALPAVRTSQLQRMQTSDQSNERVGPDVGSQVISGRSTHHLRRVSESPCNVVGEAQPRAAQIPPRGTRHCTMFLLGDLAFFDTISLFGVGFRLRACLC
jgi:hypothetical protein